MYGINTSLLPAKLHYFAFFASHAGILPFSVTIAAQFGASPALVGVIFLTLPFIAVIAKPGFGVLADKLQGKKSIFLSCVLLMTGAFFAICFIPPVEHVKRTSNLLCHNEGSSLETCNLRLSGGRTESPTTNCNATCDVTLSDPNLGQLCTYHPSYCSSRNETTQTVQVRVRVKFTDETDSSAEEGCVRHVIKSNEIFNETIMTLGCFNATVNPCNVSCDGINASPDMEVSGVYEVNPQIIYFWILMITAYIFMGTATSLGDTIVLDTISNYGDYGKQRLYGGIGFGLLSIVSGQLVDTFSEGNGGKLNFTPAYCVVIIFGVLDFIVALFFKEKKVEKPKHLFKNVGRLFLKAETMLLTAAVFLVGFFSGILWTFLIVYLVSLGANQLLIGLTMGMQCFVGEIPFMFVSEWFLKKIGHGHSMTLVLAVFGIRFLLYHLIADPWLVLPIEITQGICFGIFFTALATYGSIIAPPSSHSTMQGILQAVFEGLGGGLGSFFGGLIYEATSGKTMWLIVGVISCTFAVLHALVLFAIQRMNNQTKAHQKDLANGMREPKEAEMLQMISDQSENVLDATRAVDDFPKE